MTLQCPLVCRKRGVIVCGGKDSPFGKCEMYYDDRYSCEIKQRRMEA